MKTKVVYIALFGLLLLIITLCIVQNKRKNMYDDKEKSKDMYDDKEIGIEILNKEFDRKLESCINIMKSNDIIDIQDYIDMVRVYNTLNVMGLVNEKESYKEFMRLFTPNYLELAAKQLDATLTKGMCYYSKKYDLYIGGKPHKNSQFRIIIKQK